ANALDLAAVHVAKALEQAREAVAALVAEAEILALRGRINGRKTRVKLHIEVVILIDAQRGRQAQLFLEKPAASLHKAAGFRVR
nr:hypothetical protein [Tanacetum cinerariifolium]